MEAAFNQKFMDIFFPAKQFESSQRQRFWDEWLRSQKVKEQPKTQPAKLSESNTIESEGEEGEESS